MKTLSLIVAALCFVPAALFAHDEGPPGGAEPIFQKDSLFIQMFTFAKENPSMHVLSMQCDPDSLESDATYQTTVDVYYDKPNQVLYYEIVGPNEGDTHVPVFHFIVMVHWEHTVVAEMNEGAVTDSGKNAPTVQTIPISDMVEKMLGAESPGFIGWLMNHETHLCKPTSKNKRGQQAR